MSYFWQDLGRFSWKFFRMMIILAGICFLSLIIYFRPDLYVTNVFQDLRELKTVRASFEEKNQKIINEIKELKKEIQILKQKDNELKEKNKNLQKQISDLEESMKTLEKLREEEKLIEKENLISK